MNENTNALIKETSPYLLQHAHNPVDWMPWGEEAFEKAAAQNKLVIVSIGYSSCHWCHVMERESFEDSAVAKLMNDHFISIKVDREERPDVDQVYMTAVQLMTGSGGWPLNVVTLPDGRPVYGGTYFPKENWMQVLAQVQEMYATQPEKVEEYAEKLTAGVQQTELVEVNTALPDFSKKDAESLFENWKTSFDKTEGGPDRAPKFPLPNNYEYLLQFGHLAQSEEALAHVQLTLKKMAYGGIYDQVGGGFARYSTDEKWKVPHFEKMLYDNAQLVSLYSRAFQQFKDPLYQQTVEETLAWIDREMTGPEGEFYSALDADSEGEEGKFYVWGKEELQQLIPTEEWKYFEAYYNINSKGKWENGRYILLRSDKAQEEFKLPEGRWEQLADSWKKTLLTARSQRVRPALDDKSLTSWNALMITGLGDAYKAFAASHPNGQKGEKYLQRAQRTAQWLLKNQARKDGSLYHSYRAGTSSIDGLIEDYAFSIQAFLKLYEVTGEEKYLRQADSWMAYAKKHFEDTSTGLFYTRSLHSTQLIAKSLETTDNVIPAANSVMAKNLFTLGLYLDKSAYSEQATHMLNQVNKDRLLQYGDNYSNWGQLLLKLVYPHFEVAIAGKKSRENYLEFQKKYLPNVVWAVSKEESALPLLENRFVKGATKIYVCQDMVCQLPVEEVDKALNQMAATR